MKTFLLGVTVAGCLSLVASTAGAQVPAGTIYGSIHDSTGARLPGASVIVVHEGTNAQREVVTDDQGRFTVSPLPVGRYTVRAMFEGFQAAQATGVSLQVDERREVNLTLGVAGSQESVTVAAEIVIVPLGLLPACVSVMSIAAVEPPATVPKLPVSWIAVVIAPLVPSPVRVTCCIPALLANVIDPVRVPTAVGLKRIVHWRDCPPLMFAKVPLGLPASSA